MILVVAVTYDGDLVLLGVYPGYAAGSHTFFLAWLEGTVSERTPALPNKVSAHEKAPWLEANEKEKDGRLDGLRPYAIEGRLFVAAKALKANSTFGFGRIRRCRRPRKGQRQFSDEPTRPNPAPITGPLVMGS